MITFIAKYILNIKFSHQNLNPKHQCFTINISKYLLASTNHFQSGSLPKFVIHYTYRVVQINLYI